MTCPDCAAKDKQGGHKTTYEFDGSRHCYDCKQTWHERNGVWDVEPVCIKVYSKEQELEFKLAAQSARIEKCRWALEAVLDGTVLVYDCKVLAKEALALLNSSVAVNEKL